jgi:dimethylargininase
MGAPPTAGLVRRPPDTYAPAYHRRGIAIDAAATARQHAAYVAALQTAGISVHTIDGDAAYYDCVFVEDTAIVWGSSALICRTGNPDRDGEQQAVRAMLGRSHTLSEVPAGGRIDGGDVLHCEDTTFVGQSSRTNEIGIDALRRFLEPCGRMVVAVPVERALHLKSAVTYLGDGVLIAACELIDLRPLADFEVLATAPGEAGAANCLRVGRHLMIPAGYAATETLLTDFAQRHRLGINTMNISEFEKGGGGLTCLSLLWSPD